MADVTEADHGRDQFEIVIAGAGVAGLEAAFALRETVHDRAKLTLVAPADEFIYRPMAVGEPFSSGWAQHYPLADLASEAGARLVREEVTQVDADRRIVRTRGGTELSYDALLVCLGARIHERYEHATTVDDARMDELLHGLVQDIEEGYVKRLAVVIPAPMPWPLPAYELALMCSERAWDMQTDLSVTVLTPEEVPLAVFGRQASQAMSRLLADRKVEVVTSAYSEMTHAKAVTVQPGGGTLEFDRIVALPELLGPLVAGLPHDRNGFIPIDEHLRVRGADRVWAAGDATDFPIKHGGVSAQMADAAALSIAACLGLGAEPAPFEPELEGVVLTGGTPRYIHGRPTGGHGDPSEMSELPHGARPPKIAARYLTPHLRRRKTPVS